MKKVDRSSQWIDIMDKVGFQHSATKTSFLRQLRLCTSSPMGSSTQIAGRSSCELPWSEAISTYRFMDNDNVTLKALREFRRELTLSSLPKGSDVLIMNDVSLLDYHHHNSKKDRRAIGDGKGKGYEYNCNLAINPENGSVLGVVHDCLVNTDGPDDVDMVDYNDEYLQTKLSKNDLEKIKENHKHQMVSHIRSMADFLKPWNPIHVGDREFDDIFIMQAAIDEGHDFVLRAMNLRNVQIQKADWLPETSLTGKQAGHPLKEFHVYTRISDIIQHIPLEPYKDLPLDAKGRVCFVNSRKRTARLHIGSVPISLYRQAKRNRKYIKTPNAVDVNLVVIKELDPPQGKDPLCWLILTNRNVDNLEGMAAVARIYELRWKIEEFFRLLKTSYRLEEVRYNSAVKIARYIILSTIAVQMLMRIKDSADITQTAALNEEEYTRVREAMQKPEDESIDINLRLLALVVKRGGWLGRRRDPIGSTILARGMVEILSLLQFVQVHKKLIKELQTQHGEFYTFGFI